MGAKAMGGAAGGIGGGMAGAWLASSILTGGLSAIPAALAMTLGGAMLGSGGGMAAGHSSEQSAKEAQGKVEEQTRTQNAISQDLASKSLQPPTKVSPDDFLSMRDKQLRTLRMGLASTITGAGGAPKPILSAPSLTPQGQGKSKLGS